MKHKYAGINIDHKDHLISNKIENSHPFVSVVDI